MKKGTIYMLFIMIPTVVWSQTACDMVHRPFRAGEFLEYEVSYDWSFITFNAGEVTFKVSEEERFGKQVYHMEGYGTTYESYDWMYKVRDKYDTWIDTADLSPHLFYRTADEGGHTYANHYNFNREVDSIYAKSVTEDEVVYDTLTYEACLFDVLSLVYYCRTIDLESYEINEKIPLSLMLDGEKTEIYIRYLGKELQEIEGMGTFKALKFSALLVEGSMFSGGEDMYIWVTDDSNRFPVRVQAEILIGSVNATLKGYENLKYPLQAKLNNENQ